jgi:hypothetical protein
MSKFVNTLPADPFLVMSRYLSFEDISNCGLVCKGWNAHDHKVWGQHVAKMIYGKAFDEPDIKANLQQYLLRSNDEIVNRFQDFMNRVSKGTNPRFLVYLAYDPTQFLSVSIITAPRRVATDRDFKKQYLAFNGFGDGLLTTDTPPPHGVRSVHLINDEDVRIQVPVYGTNLAIISLPEEIASTGIRTALVSRIKHIIIKRFDQFETLQRKRRDCVGNAAAVVMVAALAFCMSKLYQIL